eukprot:130913-Alexandrium_andersonii.AAC.1
MAQHQMLVAGPLGPSNKITVSSDLTHTQALSGAFRRSEALECAPAARIETPRNAILKQA